MARILVLDDDPFVLRALVRALAGHEVTAETSALAALEQIALPARFDVVVCDVNMPEMNANVFYAATCVHRPELAERFVFVSGDSLCASDPFYAARTLLGKPVLPEELDRAISAIMIGRAR